MDDVIQVYTNNKGAQSIIYQKYSFRLFRTNKNSGDLVWRCNNKLCSVMVTTNSNVNVFIKQNKSEHHHETNEINPELKEIRCAVKRKSKLDLNEKPLKIIRKELCTSSVSADNIDAMRQSMYRERRKFLPPVPVSLSDALNKEYRYNTNISDYKFSVSDLALTRQQQDFYEVNGYLVIPKLIPDYLLDRCCNRFMDLCHGRVPRNQITMMKDISRMKVGGQGEYLFAKAQDLLWDEEFYEYARFPKMLDYIESFIGPNVMAMHSMFINKQPDIGTNSSRHPVHQDLHYFPFRPANLIVAAWTACVPVTVDNGCLYVLPGTHTGDLYPHNYPEPKYGEINKMYHEAKISNDYDDHKKVFLEMDKGDTVFFHPLLLHGSGINKTQDLRKVISVHYASSNCHYIDVSGTTQDNIKNEIIDVMAKKGIKNVDYTFAWKHRCRLIRGVKANL